MEGSRGRVVPLSFSNAAVNTLNKGYMQLARRAFFLRSLACDADGALKRECKLFARMNNTQGCSGTGKAHGRRGVRVTATLSAVNLILTSS